MLKPIEQRVFVGLIHSCIDTEKRTLDEMLGPVSVRVMGRHARGDRAALDAHDGFIASQFAGIVWKLLKWRVRGDHKRSPFFDAKTGAPVAEPHLISEKTLSD